MNVFYFITIAMLIEFSFVSSQCCGGCGASTQLANVDPNQAINGLDYFLGDWVGLDYECYTGTKIMEQVTFPKVSNQIFAKKVTGDNCVTAGNLTFKFASYPSELKYKVNYPVIQNVGDPKRPNSGTINVNLQIVDKDNFLLNGVKRFVRGRLDKDGKLVKIFAQPPAPKPCKRTFVKEIMRQTLDDKGRVISTTRERIIETWAERTTNEWETSDKLLILFDNSFKPIN
jgi:hypothetical protein